MAIDLASELASLTEFADVEVEWVRLRDREGFGYPIDYSIAVLGAVPEAGRIDFLVKWEPDSYCHFHRHLGHTTAVVLEGEHHVIEESPTETVHKTRTPRHQVRNPPGDVHMERGGSAGSLLFFSMDSADGRVFDILDRQENVLVTVTLEDMASGRLGALAADETEVAV